jgi:hypothetical protein
MEDKKGETHNTHERNDKCIKFSQKTSNKEIWETKARMEDQ